MGERILVVEDEHTLCTNVARALGRAGHSVTAVETGRAALFHHGERHPALHGMGHGRIITEVSPFRKPLEGAVLRTALRGEIPSRPGRAPLW